MAGRLLFALAFVGAACFQLKEIPPDGDNAAGGGDPPDAAAAGDAVRCEHRSGSRLVVRNTAVDDVNTVPRLYDQELESTCTPTPHYAATLCLPDGLEAHSIWFLDAGCESAVLALLPGAAAPTLPVVRDAYAPHVEVPFFEIGAPMTIAAGTPVFSRLASGGCGPAGTSGDGQFWAAAQAPHAFVTLHRLPVSTPPEARYEFIALESADGARLCSRSLRDRELGFECVPRVADDGAVRCLPNSPYVGVSTGSFADAGCTTPQALAMVYPGADTVPAYVSTQNDFSDCPNRGYTYRIGDAVTTSFRLDGAGACVAASNSPDVAIRAAEAVATAGILGDLVLTPRATAGRLAQLDYVSADGVSVASPLFRDRELGRDCSAAFGGRCLPVDFFQEHGTEAYRPSGTVFADGLCTKVIATAYAPAACGAAGLPAFGVRGDGVRPVVSRLEAPIYYVAGDSTCQPVEPVRDDAWFVLGDALPESTWAVAYEP